MLKPTPGGGSCGAGAGVGRQEPGTRRGDLLHHLRVGMGLGAGSPLPAHTNLPASLHLPKATAAALAHDTQTTARSSRAFMLLPTWPDIVNVALHKPPENLFLWHKHSAPIQYDEQRGQGSKRFMPKHRRSLSC